MLPEYPYSIFPLGDSAVTIDFGNVIDEAINKKILAFFSKLRKEPFYGMIEAVPAYSSLSIFYDPVILRKNISASGTILDHIKEEIEKFIRQTFDVNPELSAIIKVPVCYDKEFGTDLERISELKKIEKEEIVRLHCSKLYRVYMIGFLPGFPYMGEADEKIYVPRKSQPENVASGSVAIAGRQIGIYSLASPGGWSVIGRTPLKLFDATKKNPSLFNAGDTVEFYSISKDEFLNIQK
ncbi:MAG TPA: 5-oxoprolinase subunit PxpB [Chitinophagaceae bacterium]|nr:5-oxoprolinase subunit PxpB [Chitinophagaceae bacterium]